MCGFNVFITPVHYGMHKHIDVPIDNELILKHRGPDKHTSIAYTSQMNTISLSFDRLAIIDLEGGNQPIIRKIDGKHTVKLLCNGEIYNYQYLRKICKYHNIHSDGSDCEVIGALFEFYIQKEPIFDAFKHVVQQLDGDFAIFLEYGGNILIARDPIGVRPLFYSISRDNISIASEMKGCYGYPVQLEPGTIGYINLSNLTELHEPDETYYHTITYNILTLKSEKYITFGGFIHDDIKFIKPVLIDSVKKRLMSERPLAYFLSGGLDSSIIASIGQSLSSVPIKTFSIGIEGSPDLKYAKLMAEYLKSDHTEVKLDIEECLKSLNKLIYHIESYDCTTVRASMPMYMLSKYVSTQTPYRVVISGEGSDELFGGYLYFHNAPNNQAFQQETERLVKELHKFDVLRGDRWTASHGLEIRVPFLDKEFVQKVITLNTCYKRPNEYITKGGLPNVQYHERSDGIEKFILREAFKDMLPSSIYSRQKEAFSDGVGYSWVSKLKECADLQITNEQMNDAPLKYPNNTPLSKEEYYYRQIFESAYPGRHDVIPHMWRPRWTDVKDPSATMLSMHKK